MRLKYAITIGDPKSAQIVELQARSTGNSHLTRDDIIVSLGLTQSRCRAGLSLIYAKYTKDPHAAQTALIALRQYASSVISNYIPKNGGPVNEAAVSVLAMLALEEFCRTADTPGAMCRCGGKGTVKDLKKSQQKNRPQEKTCPRCKGSGLRPLTQTRCHHALLKVVSISQSTYSRYWSPFYRDLLNWCNRQESVAEQTYNMITNLNPSHSEANLELAISCSE